MRKISGFIADVISPVFDLILVIVAIPSALILKSYRRFGATRLRMTTAVLKAIGVFPIRDHYYEPLFNDRLLTRPLDQERALPGIDLASSRQVSFLRLLRNAKELVNLKLDDPDSRANGFLLRNGSFGAGDAEFLYQFIRFVKPRRVIEIGSGHSTMLAKTALQANHLETGIEPEHTCIEPYEMPWLETLGVTVVRKRVEECSIELFTQLEASDLLFIDSSHVIRPQGDVLFEYLDVLPRMKPGVYVHIHDIFTPRDYPRAWVVDEVRFWNEQYVLEALLSTSSKFEVIGALNYLKHNFYSDLKEVCPYLSLEDEPGSFYIKAL